MPFLRNIGLLVTYKCQVACRHCIIEAGPHRKEEMSIDNAFNWIKQISDYRNGYIKVLSLTGGEPFYNVTNLRKLARYADDCGLLVSVVTNAYWAKDVKEAVNTIKDIPEIGMIAISTDVYHQENIPFKNIKNAVKACEELNIPYNIHVCTENETDEKHQRIVEKLLEITDKDNINTAITLPAGRALEEIDDFQHLMSEEPPISACSAGSSPIIFPNGNITACIGPIIKIDADNPLLLGNLNKEPLNVILDKAEINPVLHAIRIWGPKRLINMIEESDFKKYLPKSYIKGSVCDACYNLMINDHIVNYLKNLSKNSEFIKKVAYARAYYLKETEMIESLKLNEH